MRRILAAFLCAALLLTAGCAKPQQSEPVLAETLAVGPGMRGTVLYYQEASGLLVPVMKEIPWEEGIGKAALNNLTDTEENAAAVKTMGLSPVVPEGVEFELRIYDGGAARVNLKHLPELPSAWRERNLLAAVTNTLVEFSAIDTVEFLFDGEKKQALPNGTDVSKPFGRMQLNPETLSVMGGDSGENTVELYFSNLDGTLHVPVTRSLSEEPTLEQALSELLKGPAQTDALQSCFPDGTRLLGVTVERGVAVVNLSREFENVEEFASLPARAEETLALTCRSFGVPSVQILVEGKEWSRAAAAPLYVNRLR